MVLFVNFAGDIELSKNHELLAYSCSSKEWFACGVCKDILVFDICKSCKESGKSCPVDQTHEIVHIYQIKPELTDDYDANDDDDW